MRRQLRSLIVTRNGENLSPLLAALEGAGFDPWWDWERVEFEDELATALERGTYDVLIFEHGCAIHFDRVLAIAAAQVPDLPIVVRATLDTLAADVQRALLRPR